MASKSGVLAGKAYVLLEAIDGTAATLRNVENRFLSWGTRLQATGARIFASGLTGMVPAALSTNIFKQFDDIMRRVEARTQGTSSEMKSLRDQAIGLGRDSAFSAREVAGLQDVLAQRKFDRTQIEQMTPSILMLGRAAGGGDNPGQDLLNAADLVSQAIMMYEMSATDAAAVSDVFTAAANESNFALEDLIISMANAGPVAHQYGMSLEETLAAMMVMRDISIDPSIAGTGLRNLFIKASDQKAVEDFNELMMDTVGATLEFKDAMGNLNSVTDILFNFDKITKGLGTATRGHLLAELFGLRAITPATAVAANSKNFTDALAVLQNSAGETKKAYDKMEAGIGGAFRRLGNTLEAAALQYGDALEEPIIAFSKVILTLNLAVADWIKANQSLVVQITGVIGVLLPLGAALFLTGAAFKILAYAIMPVRIALGLMISSVKILWAWLIGPLLKATYMVIAGFIQMTIQILTVVIPAFISLSIQAVSSLISIAIAAFSYVIPALMAIGMAIVSLISTLVALAPELALALLVIAPFLLLVALGAFSVKEEVSELNEEIDETGKSVEQTKSIWASAVDSMMGWWNSLTSTVSASFDFIIQRAVELGATLMQTMKGITTALMAGDLDLAWKIATAGMMLAWTQLLDGILDGWRNMINQFKLSWLDFRIWLNEKEGEWNPFADALANLEQHNALMAERNKTIRGEFDQNDDDREAEKKYWQTYLDHFSDLADKRAKWVQAVREGQMANLPPDSLGIREPQIRNLIRNGAARDIGGAKAMDASTKYTVEGAKQAYENNQNRLEAIQNKELEKLGNIDVGIKGVNEKLQGLLDQPEPQGV